MAQVGFGASSTRIQRTSVFRSMDISDVYRITRGISDDWGMSEYSPPRQYGTYRSISYEVPKEAKKSFIQTVSKNASKTPGVGKYELGLSWNTANGTISKSPKQTFIDKIGKDFRNTPSPNSYSPKKVSLKRVSGFSPNRTTDLDFMGDAVFNARQVPGVGKYNVSDEKIRRKSPTYKWNLPVKLKPLDKQKIGPGSYDFDRASSVIKETPRRQIMARSKERNIFFKRRAFETPGVGSYATEQVDNVWKGFKRR